MEPNAPQVSALSVLAFLGELLLLWALAVAGTRFAGGVTGVLLAVALVGGLVVVWGRWLAPRSSRRLASRGRVPVKLALVAAAAGLLAASGQPLSAVAVALVAGTALVVAELRDAAG